MVKLKTSSKSLVTCDMSPAFIKGIREELPEAEVTFGKFHIIKIINEAVNAVRKEEAKNNPLLAGARYALLKNENNLTAKQKTIRGGLRMPGLNLKYQQRNSELRLLPIH